MEDLKKKYGQHGFDVLVGFCENPEQLVAVLKERKMEQAKIDALSAALHQISSYNTK